MKRGRSLFKTFENSSLLNPFEISKTFGRIKGKRYGSFISSNRLGNTLPFLRRSENVGTTRTKPLKKVAFSSRGFDANVVGSRKLSVEIASDEKNG